MSMTPEERITNMTKAINQAIKVMGDRFGSTEEDVARAIQGLKASMQTASQEKPVSVGGAT
ncbi:MAG: hypothetical protein KA426_17570, partial [Nitrospira sp.]|nr:hypothetical protein [Nitrospira sp.]